MNKLKWFFCRAPADNPNYGPGPNDSGIEHFRGEPIKGVVRESIQNSLDVRLDKNKPVDVRFEFGTINRNQIPDIDELVRHIKICGEQYANYKNEAGAAVKILLSKEIPYLKISDRNTTGAPGKDDEENSDWKRLIYTPGDCDKPESSGGSFGIGKSSYFALSHPRTVLFCTTTSKGDTAFIGLTRQAKHKDGGDKLLEIGYLTVEKTKSVRKKNEIPEFMQKAQSGLDIFILGVRGEEAENMEEAIAAVCSNFYLAILNQDLKVTVSKINQKAQITINHETIDSIFDSFSSLCKDEFNCFRAVRLTNPIQTHLKNLGVCKLYLLTNELGSPQRIAFFRRGMLIYLSEFRTNVPFSGTFFCEDENGNALLRKLEPPQHTSWEPKRDPSRGKVAIDEIRVWIRTVLREIASKGDSEPFTLVDLANLLPDTGDQEEGATQNETGAEKTDFPLFDSKPSIIEIHEKPKELEPYLDLPGNQIEGPGPGPKPGPGPGPGPGPSPGPGPGPHIAGTDYNPIQITSNSWKNYKKAGWHKIVIRSGKNYKKVYLRIAWVAEDGTKDYFSPKIIKNSDGENIKVDKGGLIGPLRLEGASLNKFDLETQSEESAGIAVGAFIKNEK